MGLIDFKHKLALFAQPLRTVITLSVAVVVFLIWDLVGIALGIFSVSYTHLTLPTNREV